MQQRQSLCFLLLVCAAWTPHQCQAFLPIHSGESRIFLDSGNEDEWDALLGTGIFHGVVTNPFVLLKDNQACTVENLHRMAGKALLLVQEFMVQTWGSTVDEMYQNGMSLSSIARDKIVIKVPVTLDGVKAGTKLIQAGCRVCLTALYDHKQAFTGVAMGAEYLAPCIGIMDDVGRDGQKECMKMLEIVKGMKGETRIMNACIRDVDLLSKMATSGMETFCFSPAIARELFDNDLTVRLAEDFERVARIQENPEEGSVEDAFLDPNRERRP